MAILPPSTLAGTPQWSGLPTLVGHPQRVSQPLKLVLVHCLGVARGYCETELSPALPGALQRGLSPNGERQLSGLELRVRGRVAASLPSW